MTTCLDANWAPLWKDRREQARVSDDELAQVAAKCSDPEGWKATSELVGILGRDGSCVRKS